MSDAVLAERRSAEKTPPGAAVGSRAWTIGLGALVALVAVALRAYLLRDVPRLTDETDEVMRGLAIARGELLPLTNVDAYIGPLWNYLLAFGFLIVGPSSLLPRVLTLLVGVATVAATVWLGRELAVRLSLKRQSTLLALGAALLIGMSSFHVVVSSRIAWSHALTPLLVTVALALLTRWERTRETPTLAWAGLAYGLAVHTHPTALALAPGLGIWALLQWRQTLLARAGWLALGLFVLANLPMLTYNVATGFGSASAAAQVQNAYAAAAPTSSGGYLSNLAALLTSWPLLISGEIGDRRGAVLALDDPLPFLYAGLAVLGLLITARRRVLLPVLLSASSALVLPLVNGKYEPLFNGRYLAPLLPLAFVLTVAGVVWLVGWLPAIRTHASLVSACVLSAMTIPSLLALNGYIQTALGEGPNNAELYRAAEIVAAANPRGPVLVDASLSGTRQSTGRDGTGVVEYLLMLDHGLAVRRYQPNDLAQAVERGEGDLLVVAPRLLTRLDKDFITEAPPGEDEARRRRRAGFVIVRIVGPA